MIDVGIFFLGMAAGLLIGALMMIRLYIWAVRKIVP